MKNRSILATLLCTTSLAFAQIEISPETDPFPEPANAEIPCMVGFSHASPTLGQGTIQYNTYYSPLLAVNPNDASRLISAMNIDRLQVTFTHASTTFTSVPRPQEVALARSASGGNTWANTFIPFHLCLDGSLSNGQSVSSLRWSPLGGRPGTIFMAGRFSDVQNSTDPNNFSGIWVTRSTDYGRSWTGLTPSETNGYTIVSVQDSDAFTTFVGTADGTPDLTFDPNQQSNIYMAWDRPVYSVVSGYPNTIPTAGNIFFSRSNNNGASWSSPVKIYDIKNDIPSGGQCTGVSMATAVKGSKTKNLLSSFMRYYSNSGQATFDKTVATTTTDRVVIRSSDEGAYWKKHAQVVSKFVYAQSYNPTAAAPSRPVFPAPDGSELAHMVVNPSSGRVYLMWQAGSLAISNPTLAAQHPEIVVSVSKDSGVHWSDPVKVSRTSTKLLTSNPPAYQAFNGNIVILPNDMIGVVYYDFRNFRSGSAVASTDCWLAVYKETDHDSDDHVGLEFVSETRITNPSFDFNIATKNSVNNIMNGIGNVVGVAGAGSSVFAAYAITNPGQDSTTNISTVTVPSLPTVASVDTNHRLSVEFQSVLVATPHSSSSSSSSDDDKRLPLRAGYKKK